MGSARAVGAWAILAVVATAGCAAPNPLARPLDAGNALGIGVFSYDWDSESGAAVLRLSSDDRIEVRGTLAGEWGPDFRPISLEAIWPNGSIEQLLPVATEWDGQKNGYGPGVVYVGVDDLSLGSPEVAQAPAPTTWSTMVDLERDASEATLVLTWWNQPRGMSLHLEGSNTGIELRAFSSQVIALRYSDLGTARAGSPLVRAEVLGHHEFVPGPERQLVGHLRFYAPTFGAGQLLLSVENETFHADLSPRLVGTCLCPSAGKWSFSSAGGIQLELTEVGENILSGIYVVLAEVPLGAVPAYASASAT